MSFRLLLPEDRKPWDEFVMAHPCGSPFHLLAWKESIEETFGYKSRYLVAAEGGRIRGVLPLFLVRNVLVGKVLISSPFAVYGGILADAPETYRALYAHAKTLGQTERVDYIELRNLSEHQCVGVPNVSRYVAFSHSIGPDEKSILASIPRKTRYMVRKAMRHPFTTRREASDFTAFERLHSRNLRKLGTPSFPSRHFAALLKHFRGQIDIREVVLDSKVVAAVMSFYFRDQVLPYYGASDPCYHEQAPNDFMYFDLMRWAGQNGYTKFDFGRSRRESGSFAFKAHWGMTMKELPYERVWVKAKQFADYCPNSPRFRLAMRLWRRLPLTVTRALGPRFVRLVP